MARDSSCASAINNGGHVCDEDDVQLSIVVSLFVEAIKKKPQEKN